ncbi:MAG: tetratricopeptide repeat protein [Anaerolineales bacterium]|nr:tetratricopeptide repeat protein [Anaerolineales bacterium]
MSEETNDPFGASNGEQNNELIFQDAVKALRGGDKTRAKELLTFLLKSESNNATYWVWLSAAVDADKERIYCLQSALKLDPENSTAKRGLILLGALSPDETIQPFVMNRPRAWEEKLLLAHEKPRERGARAALRSPLMRLGGLAVIGVGLFALIYFVVLLPRRATSANGTRTNTPGPSPTFSATPTLFGATAIPSQVFSGPTPLSAFLEATYTPTPLYVNTPRSAAAVDQYRVAKAAYNAQQWDEFIQNMKLIEPLEPQSADIPYYIAEAYRFKGEAFDAKKYYNKALGIDSKFAPAYLGLARAGLMEDPKRFDPKKLFNQAVELDPNFGETYIERALWLIERGKYKDAMPDLELAEKIMPGSPEVSLAYAQAYLGAGDADKALSYAQKAREEDVLHLPTYKLLGNLYVDRKEYDSAVEALLVYTTYASGDASGFGKLGEAYYRLGEYKNAVNAINAGEKINRNGMKKYLIYRGLANVKLGNFRDAEGDLNAAVEDDSTSFEARLGYAEALYGIEKYGSAFLQAEAMRGLESNNEEKALELYWRARIQEKRNDIRDAIKSWNDLLKMDKSAMTKEMRDEAQARLAALVPPTNTPKGSKPTSTPMPKASATPKVTSTP